MENLTSHLFHITVMMTLCVTLCFAREHIVGDSIWTIPLTNDFYINWSNNISFTVGDSLVFKFETGFYDVVQVSRREFDGCSAEDPFRKFSVGSATVNLDERGMHYFVCSLGNYCSIGMKFSIVVQ